jgi:hypothetical protein
MVIDEIIHNVARDLAAMYNNSKDSILIFPAYRQGNTRVSEQESKILFSKYFFQNNMLFSVEAPTKEIFSFSGQTKKSARSDMLTYKDISRDIEWMIELKKGKQEKEIRKDFQKMVTSNEDCIWFQTLEKSSQKEGLPERMNKILKKEISLHTGRNATWKIAIVVLNSGILYTKDITLKADYFDSIAESNPFREEIVFEGVNTGPLDNKTPVLSAKTGKSMIYAKKINEKTFLHFSWGKGSGFLRDYSVENNGSSLLDKTRSISEVRSLIDREVEIKRNSPDIKDYKYWHEKTVELNKEML